MMLVVAAALVPVAALLYVILRPRTRAAEDAWARTLARRVGGTFVPVTDPESPWIRFTVGDRAAEFWFGPWPQSDVPVSVVEVDVGGLSPGALKVFRGALPALIKKVFRFQDLEVGDAGFDRDWVIQANPESLARGVFSAEERGRLIWHLRRLGVAGPPLVELTQDTLTVGIGARVRDLDVLRTVVEAAAAFLKRMVALHPSAGISWADVGTGRCPVCASVLEGARVSCGSCRTAHHEECWRWTGSCSRYACRERRWVRA